VVIGLALYGLLVTGYLLARITVGESWSAVAFANNFVPWVGIGSLIAAGIGLLMPRRRRLLLFQVPGLVAFVVLYGGLFWPDRPAPKGDLHLTAATYNIQSMASEPADVAATIDAVDADIIALQELDPTHAPTILERVGEKYPYRIMFTAPTQFGLGFLSRYPILEHHITQDFYQYVRHMRVVLDVEGVQVVVYVSHAETPDGFRSPLQYDTTTRDDQLSTLREQVNEEHGPVIVLCDCNMTDQSDAYRSLNDELVDSFRDAGRGLGFTFSVRLASGRLLPPMMRIDYVWHNHYFAARKVTVWNASGTSDHRPVVAELVLETGVPANASRPD
jgi:vancomycin resistance protein VanJ